MIINLPLVFFLIAAPLQQAGLGCLRLTNPEKPKPRVVVQIVEWGGSGHEDSVRNLVLSTTGKLYGVPRGEIDDDDLRAFLGTRLRGDTESTRYVHVMLRDEKDMPVHRLTMAIERLKAAADSKVETIIFIHLKALLPKPCLKPSDL